MNRLMFTPLALSLLLTACPTDTDPEISADEQVRRAFNAIKAASHYRINGVAESSLFDKPTIYNIDYQAPDRYHVTMHNGPEVIVIGDKSWGYDSTESKWIVLAKPNPDPRSLLTPFEPGEITGFAYVKFDPNFDGCELLRAKYDKLSFDVCIVPKTVDLRYLEFRDDTGLISHIYSFKTPISINPPSL
jgi:hypothetical protein